MKRHFQPLLLTLIIAFALTSVSFAQIGGGHTLYGDFKIEGFKDDVSGPQNFHLLLYSSDLGRVLFRQPINNNGRYRFFGVVNGPYVLIIEFENQEIGRMDVVIGERTKTDIRRDVTMQWRSGTESADPAKTSSISVADHYARLSENRPLFDKAMEAIKKDDNNQAINLLRQVVNADPKDFEAWTELGTAYFKQKKFDDAEKAYLAALEQRPAYIVALLNIGKLRISQKKYETAIEVLTQAIGSQPQSAEINYWLGEAYLQIKKGSKAVGYLNEAIRLDPTGMAEVHLRLAALYNAAGLKDRAAAEYEQFLAKKPDYQDKKKLEQYIQENKKS